MMHLNFDKKSNQLLFESIFVCLRILKVVINENGYTEHIVNLLKNPNNASLDRPSYGKAISHKIAVKVLLLDTALKIYLLFGLTMKNLCVHLQKQSLIGLHLNNSFESFAETLEIPIKKVFFRNF